MDDDASEVLEETLMDESDDVVPAQEETPETLEETENTEE